MTSAKSPLISKSTNPPLPSSYPRPPGPDSHTQPFPSYSHFPYNDPYYRFHCSSTATPYYLPPTPYYPPPTPHYPPPMQMSPPQMQHNHNPFIAVVRSGKCVSCGRSFTKDKQVIVIKHVEKDIYTKEGETRISSDRPRYYHATLQCLQYFKHSYFNRSLLEIDSDMF